MKAQCINDHPRQILLVGGDGLIGKALQCRWGAEKLLCTSRRLKTQSTGTLMWDLVKPMPNFSLQAGDVVLMAAALTSLEACEKNGQLAHRVNVEAPVEVAGLCARKGARLIFLSSSAVFGGQQAFPEENDKLCPVNEYGRTKAEAEKRIQDSGATHLILRLTKVLNPAGGYLAGLLRALSQGERVKASPDLPVAPLSLPWTLDVITRCLSFSENGIYHLSPRNETNFFNLAEKAALKHGLKRSLIQRQPLAELQQRLPQIPKHAALAAKQSATKLGMSFPFWEKAVDS